jgi:flagellar motor switch protein FliG
MADQQARNLSGTEKAAVFLRSLGEEDASEVLKHMTPKEVTRIGEAMASLTNVNREDVQTVLDIFVTTAVY